MPRKPARLDLTIWQGEDFALNLGARYFDETTATMQLLNTAGYTARMKVRATYDGPVLLDLSTTNGRITVGIQGSAPKQWNVGLAVANGITGALTDWGSGVYDLFLTDTFGKAQPVLYGACQLQRRASY